MHIEVISFQNVRKKGCRPLDISAGAVALFLKIGNLAG